MRLTSAVDSLAKENLFLRRLTQFLVITILALGLTVLFLHEQAPLLVERSSRGFEIVRATPLNRTDEDIALAVRLMLKARFDSDSVNPEMFLSRRQMELRDAEQKELSSRGIFQGVVFRKAKISKDIATVEFDRLLSIGEVRSALKTVVNVAFEETPPSELNPYGLVLAVATPVEPKEKNR